MQAVRAAFEYAHGKLFAAHARNIGIRRHQLDNHAALRKYPGAAGGSPPIASRGYPPTAHCRRFAGSRTTRRPTRYPARQPRVRRTAIARGERSRKSVATEPRRNSSSASTLVSSARLVATPTISISPEAAAQPINRGGARFAPGDDFAEHGIVIASTLRRRHRPRCRGADPEAASGQRKCEIAPTLGRYPRAGSSAYSRASMAKPCCAISDWRSGKCAPCAMRSCHSTRSMPVMQLRHRVLHLQAGIHFHEVEVLALVDQKFDGARADVADCARCRDGGLRHCRAHLVAQARRRRFLDDFLMPALHRTIAIEKAHDLVRASPQKPALRRGEPVAK